jgi:hypothetical protein
MSSTTEKPVAVKKVSSRQRACNMCCCVLCCWPCTVWSLVGRIVCCPCSCCGSNPCYDRSDDCLTTSYEGIVKYD